MGSGLEKHLLVKVSEYTTYYHSLQFKYVLQTAGDILDCGPLSNPENGAVDTSSGTTEGSVASYSCSEGFQIKGVTSRTCTRDGWSDTEPSCERKSFFFYISADT